jgi:hypothetical protein
MKASTSASSKIHPLWGTTAGPAVPRQQARLDPPAHNCPVVHTEDSLQVTEAQPFHPARTTAALETLDDGSRRPFDSESQREARGDVRGLEMTEQGIYKGVFGLGPASAAAAATASTATRWANRGFATYGADSCHWGHGSGDVSPSINLAPSVTIGRGRLHSTQRAIGTTAGACAGAPPYQASARSMIRYAVKVVFDSPRRHPAQRVQRIVTIPRGSKTSRFAGSSADSGPPGESQSAHRPSWKSTNRTVRGLTPHYPD